MFSEKVVLRAKVGGVERYRKCTLQHTNSVRVVVSQKKKNVVLSFFCRQRVILDLFDFAILRACFLKNPNPQDSK